ncbi:hypothetical protein M9H77_18444 [Catharanthus roseus]|uniref:Uncharacterized protein n=1 Tax=Catharanthus roseus TaxID=4058 RepID=A0ACC0B7I4_CATRO|nr:hypothetical protein M9H77_18444 [Catharanthus roseus]
MALVGDPSKKYQRRHQNQEQGSKDQKLRILSADLLASSRRGLDSGRESFVDALAKGLRKGSWGWRNWIGKKKDSICKISNETVAGIEILFKEKDLKYGSFFFYIISLGCSSFLNSKQLDVNRFDMQEHQGAVTRAKAKQLKSHKDQIEQEKFQELNFDVQEFMGQYAKVLNKLEIENSPW